LQGRNKKPSRHTDVERIIFRLNESISASQEERSRQLLEKDSEHAFDAFAGKLSFPVLFDSFIVDRFLTG
jgi:hypothetical protein